MATPYFQLRFESVPSTQDVARDRFDELPLLVIAARQTTGRGRSGSGWLNADRALAASLIFKTEAGDTRPFSLIAGVAAIRSAERTSLKWPNDVLVGDEKVGGILVERSEASTIIGMGMNLWWAETPTGMASLYDEDPGPTRHLELAGLWGAEILELIDGDSWPRDPYRDACVTLGRDITWHPDGKGKAIDVASDGALVVETDSGRTSIYSGSVRHVRG